MIKTTLICDGCNEIIHPSKGMPSYYIEFNCIDYSEYENGICYDIYVIPPFENKKIFHCISCLKKYLENVK